MSTRFLPNQKKLKKGTCKDSVKESDPPRSAPRHKTSINVTKALDMVSSNHHKAAKMKKQAPRLVKRKKTQAKSRPSSTASLLPPTV